MGTKVLLCSIWCAAITRQVAQIISNRNSAICVGVFPQFAATMGACVPGTEWRRRSWCCLSARGQGSHDCEIVLTGMTVVSWFRHNQWCFWQSFFGADMASLLQIPKHWWCNAWGTQLGNMFWCIWDPFCAYKKQSFRWRFKVCPAHLFEPIGSDYLPCFCPWSLFFLLFQHSTVCRL